MVGVIDRCATGVIGFDKISKGGFVRNSDNLIVGGPGSGKTTFLLQFLWNGVNRFNENGLYISFEPDVVEILDDAMAYGWDFARLSEEGRVKFMRFSPQTSVDDLRSELVKVISKNNIRRICFDPISVLALNLSDQGKIREKIFELSSLLKRMDVTSVMADESMEGEGIEAPRHGEWTKTDILRFLSDSVTLFYDFGIDGEGDRAVRILKMRRTAHLREAVGMKIRKDGIKVITDTNQPKIEEVPDLTPTIESMVRKGESDKAYTEPAAVPVKPKPLPPPVEDKNREVLKKVPKKATVVREVPVSRGGEEKVEVKKKIPGENELWE